MPARDLLMAASGAAAPSDPDFEYVTLLLDGNGTNGGQNNTFVDSSTNNFTITRNGNTTQGSFSPYGTLWSNYFDGTGDYLRFADNAAFNLGASDWTMEAWIFVPVATAFPAIASQYATDSSSSDNAIFWCLGNSNTNLELYLYHGLASTTITATSAITLNAWNHVAAVRNGNTVLQYVNGVQVSSTSFSQTINNSTREFRIGATHTSTNSYPFTGYISNFRLVVGSAVYTSAFTPSTAPLTAITNTSLLTCQSNRFIDNSSNNFAITVAGDVSVQRFSPFEPSAPYSTSVIGGSGYFDGSGDYLNFTDSSNDLDLGGLQASFEAWVYPTGGANENMFIYKSGGTADWNTTNGILYFLNFNSSNIVDFYYNSSGNPTAISSAAIAKNQWTHVAVATNTSNNIALFINGTRVATATNAITKPTTRTTVRVGVDDTGNANYFDGYICDSRFIKGSGAYDPTQTTITIPSAPLTAITNTELMLSYTNASIFDYAMMNDLETVGNAQVSTSVKKFGTGSLYFDGTGDYLVLPSSSTMIFGGNFTIEGWIYPSSISGNKGIFAAASQRFGLIRVDDTLYWLGSTDLQGSSVLLVANSWQHFAATRNNGTLRLFLNGNLAGTLNSYTQVNSLDRFFVGSNQSNETLNGYIDDLRITNGIARYTAAFTPPTAPFPIY